MLVHIAVFVSTRVWIVSPILCSVLTNCSIHWKIADHWIRVRYLLFVSKRIEVYIIMRITVVVIGVSGLVMTVFTEPFRWYVPFDYIYTLVKSIVFCIFIVQINYLASEFLDKSTLVESNECYIDWILIMFETTWLVFTGPYLYVL